MNEKNAIRPAAKGSYPMNFYVYGHMKPACGSIFYVGMGQGARGWSAHSRNKFWSSTYKKHGARIIIFQENLDRDSAMLLEMWIIAKFKHNGVKLCNISLGGESCNGYKRSDEAKIKTAQHHKKPVFCSNGMRFESVTEAARYISIEKCRKVSKCTISLCANGRLKTAHGYTWSWNEVPDGPGPRWNSRSVTDNNGMIHSSIEDACRYLRENGYPKAAKGAFGGAIGNKNKVRYGRTWSYTS